jgi:hypothetical protein
MVSIRYPRGSNMIDFTRALELAWERTMIILLRPWDPEKWFFIGTNAFLMLLAEGVSFNSSYSYQAQPVPRRNYASIHDFLHDFNHSLAWLHSPDLVSYLLAYVWLGIIFLILWLFFNWVGCRGQFLFLDNLVRNRAAFWEPWRRYARQGNSWFVFHIVITLFTSLLTIVSAFSFFALNWTWVSAERAPVSAEIGALAGATLIFFFFWLVYSSVLFVVKSLAVPLMFRGFGFWAALREVFRITMTRPFHIVLYVIINVVLAILGLIFLMVLFFLS